MSVFNLCLTMLCLRISTTYSAPLQLQWLQPYQSILMQQQQSNIQQQLMELQAMQMNTISAPLVMNNPMPPLLFFLPEENKNINMKDKQRINDNTENEIKLKQHDIKSKDEDLDSVIIDAEPIPIIEEQKAILLLPNGRLSIGDFISAIPFLPIEINVPDTISWAYNGIANGISGIISIIGQRLPFQRPSTDSPTPTKSVNLKSMINDIHMQNRNENLRPIVMIPLGGFNRPIIPVQL